MGNEEKCVWEKKCRFFSKKKNEDGFALIAWRGKPNQDKEFDEMVYMDWRKQNSFFSSKQTRAKLLWYIEIFSLVLFASEPSRQLNF